MVGSYSKLSIRIRIRQNNSAMEKYLLRIRIRQTNPAMEKHLLNPLDVLPVVGAVVSDAHAAA